MSKVLVLVGHPNLAESKYNAALVEAVKDLDHVTVHDLYAAYPDFALDGDAERALLSEHDVVVFQHPVYWYNTTPLFRLWQDVVLTYGWAFTTDGTASQTAGKKAVVAVTVGGSEENYSPEGRNGRTVEELLNNWDNTLRLCQFDTQQPYFKLHSTVYGVPDEDLTIAGKQYRELLASFA
ncbi:NAD(P)H-dependent oxidoreductase [Streptomyces sp. NPDC000618]|uniref:NAD(P)H-dependent oxidoreductase n=1 Tax=Streptomyces sp. NPDC000618 TaxID=3154265 RepID=UPI003322CF44